MAVGLGLALILLGGAAMAFVMFRKWSRLPAGPALALVAALSVVIAAGAMLVQDEAGAASWVIALVFLGFLGPVHARLVCGPPGRDR